MRPARATPQRQKLKRSRPRPRPPRPPAVAGPTMIGDLEPLGDPPLEGAQFASIRRDRVGHQLQGEHLFLLAVEQRKDAVRRQFSQRLTELEIIGELGAKLRLACTNSRTKTAARPHLLAQSADQRGFFGETFNEDRTGACHPASSRLRPPGTAFPIRRSRWLFSTTAELPIRGGGKPYSNMALMPTERMGPPPGALPPMRMTASWSGSKRTDGIQVCGARSAPNGELPSDPPQTGTVRRRSCGSPCRRSSSLREPDRRRRVRRTAFPLRTKNRQQTKTTT